MDFNPSVQGAAKGCAVQGNGFVKSKAGGGQTVAGNTFVYQVLGNGIRTSLGQAHVVFSRADIISVSRNNFV